MHLFRLSASEGERHTERMASRSWEASRILLLCGGLLLISLLLSMGGTLITEEQLWTGRLVAVGLLYLLGGWLMLNLHRQQTALSPVAYGLDVEALKKAIHAPLLYLMMLLPFLATAVVWNFLLERFFGSDPTLQSVAEIMMQPFSWVQGLYILAAVVAAPFFEELFFRGILFPFFVRQVGLLPALLFNALLFGALHFHLPALLPLMLLAAVLGLTYWRSGSLWLCIALHALFNGFSILALRMIS